MNPSSLITDRIDSHLEALAIHGKKPPTSIVLSATDHFTLWHWMSNNMTPQRPAGPYPGADSSGMVYHGIPVVSSALVVSHD